MRVRSARVCMDLEDEDGDCLFVCVDCRGVFVKVLGC